MSDIFNTGGNKATQAVIDAASKILNGVKDDETAAAQTEDQHPAIDPKYQGYRPNTPSQEQEEVKEAKKKAKKEDEEEENLDSPGDEDGDVDNDGDEDNSDAFLSKKRKAIKKAMAKEGFELPEYVVDAIEEALAEDPDFQLDESEDLDGGSASKATMHDCAKHVVHKEHGEGQCVPGMHTIEEEKKIKCEHCDGSGKHEGKDCEKCDGEGFITEGIVTQYDVMFGDKLIQDVTVSELEVVSEMHHGHPNKKSKK